MRYAVAVALLSVSVAHSAGVKTLRLEPTAKMTRAEIDYIVTVPSPRAVLVICPGDNGKGGEIIQSPEWQKFAVDNNLGLAGLSFASQKENLKGNDGYYQAATGSGRILTDGLRKIYGENLPLLLYGFSGGAHFVSLFEEWEPGRVLAWCAYSAGWWDPPVWRASSPPGIVACGADDKRLGPALIYFKQGRALGKPWLWVCLPKTNHAHSPRLDEFVRTYFKSILQNEKREPQWVDIDAKSPVSASQAVSVPSLSGLLPSSQLYEPWSRLHEP